MRLVFLDIDGVLNNAESIREPGLFTVNRACVEQLNRICDAADASCVLSSTWRLWWPLPALQRHLEQYGLRARLVDKTPDKPDEERGTEIQAYLDACSEYGYPAKAWVILDDDSDMGALREFLVRTDFHAGLTEEDADRAIDMLRRQLD